jgi:gas vesicle protein
MQKGNASGSLVAFTIGLAAGALAALFFAPKSGEQQRNDLINAASQGVEQARSAVRKAGKRAKAAVDDATGQISDAVEAGQSAYEDELHGQRS